MLAGILLNVAQNQRNVVGGRFPPNLIRWATKNQDKIYHHDYTDLVKWVKKRKKFEGVATLDLVDKIYKSDIILTRELIELDDEEFILLFLLAANSFN